MTKIIFTNTTCQTIRQIRSFLCSSVIQRSMASQSLATYYVSDSWLTFEKSLLISIAKILIRCCHALGLYEISCIVDESLGKPCTVGCTNKEIKNIFETGESLSSDCHPSTKHTTKRVIKYVNKTHILPFILKHLNGKKVLRAKILLHNVVKRHILTDSIAKGR